MTPNKYEPDDVVFIDPPYKADLEKNVMEAFLADNKWTNEETLFIIEASVSNDLSWLTEIGYEMVKVKEYKTNKHVFVKYQKQEELL